MLIVELLGLKSDDYYIDEIRIDPGERTDRRYRNIEMIIGENGDLPDSIIPETMEGEAFPEGMIEATRIEAKIKLV